MFVEVDNHQEQIWKGTSEVFQDLHHFTLQMLKQLLQVLDQENTYSKTIWKVKYSKLHPPNVKQEANIKSIEYVII